MNPNSSQLLEEGMIHSKMLQAQSLPNERGLCRFVPQDSAMGRWFADLGRLAQSHRTPDIRDLVGRGVIIEHDDEEDASELVASLARMNGFAFRVLDRAADQAESVQDPAAGVTLCWVPQVFWSSPSDFDMEPAVDSGRVVRIADGVLDPAFRTLVSWIEHNELGADGGATVFVTSIPNPNDMPEQVRRAGRFDRRISMPCFDNETRGQGFIDALGAERADESLTNAAARVGAIISFVLSAARRRGLTLQALRRRAWQERRRVGFADLLDFAINGTGDEDGQGASADELHRTSVHEAGHALVSWLDSIEGRPPVYASARDRGNRLGVVVAHYDSHEILSRDNTRRDYDHMVRVALAGRAAESIILGVDAVSAIGSSHDLERATAMAMRMFGTWGLPVRSGDLSAAGANLAVIGDDETHAGKARTLTLVRAYLAEQFDVVCALLRSHLELLIRVADELGKRGVLFEDDFHRLLKAA